MFKILVPAIAALGLVAFTAKTQATPSDEPTAAVVAQGAAEQPVMGWHVSYEGRMAKLAYGVENSDQLAMMVTCAPGDRTAAIYGDVLPTSPRLVQASTGDDGGEARVPLNDPALKGLARDGVMPVTGVRGSTNIGATANERRVVGQFLAYCDGASA